MFSCALTLLAPQRLVHLSSTDLFIIAFYFVLVLGIGFYLKRFAKTGEDFFLAGREMTAWVAGLAFVSANLGSLELLGWAGSAYQYGILAAHWYWIGAIPAMVFLGLVMMPFYYISKTHSVPGYLQLRYGPEASGLSAASFAVMTILMSGVNMYAMAVVMQVVLGWNINFSIWVSSLTVGIYVAAGGLFSAIFNEVLQFFLIWFGALLIPILGLIETHGWRGMVARIHQRFPGQDFTHMWGPMRSVSVQPDGNSLDRNRVRPGHGAIHGLLDDGFSGGPAGACREEHSLGENGAHYRIVFQDGGAADRDSAGLAGTRGAADATGLGEAKRRRDNSATTRCCR